MPEPDLEDLRQAIIAERLRFRERVIRVLKTATQDADDLALAIGEVSPDQAYDAWVKNLIEQIDWSRAMTTPGVLKFGIGYDLLVVPNTVMHPKGTRLLLAIRCHTCQKVSYHPKDISERYCGACHVFHEEGLPSHEA